MLDPKKFRATSDNGKSHQNSELYMLLLPKMFCFLFATTLFKCHNKKQAAWKNKVCFSLEDFCTSSWMQFEGNEMDPWLTTIRIMSLVSYSACPFTRLFSTIAGLNGTKQNGHQRLIISIQQERQTRWIKCSTSIDITTEEEGKERLFLSPL